MIDLKQLKLEAQNLPNLELNFQHFNENWFKPIKAPLSNNSLTNNSLGLNHASSNLSRALPNLSHTSRLDPRIRSELFHRVQKLEEVIPRLKGSQVINEKLQGYSRILIELKLAMYSGNGLKAKALHNQLLRDDFMKLDKTIQEIKEFDESLALVTEHYLAINELMQNHLPLDERLFLTDSSDHHHLHKMKEVNQKQKKLMAEFGKQFVAMNKQMQK